MSFLKITLAGNVRVGTGFPRYDACVDDFRLREYFCRNGEVLSLEHLCNKDDKYCYKGACKYADEVVVDRNLLNELRSGRSGCDFPHRHITALDADSCIQLYLKNAGIRDLTGLDYFRNVALLDISGNEISDVSVIRRMPYLWRMYFQNNQISNINPILDFYESFEYKPLKVLLLATNPISEEDCARICDNIEVEQERNLVLPDHCGQCN